MKFPFSTSGKLFNICKFIGSHKLEADKFLLRKYEVKTRNSSQELLDISAHRFFSSEKFCQVCMWKKISGLALSFSV